MLTVYTCITLNSSSMPVDKHLFWTVHIDCKSKVEYKTVASLFLFQS